MIQKHNQCVLTRGECRALLRYASTDEARVALNCITIDWPSGAVIATDGHRLVRVNGQAPQPERTPTIVPRDAFERASKLCRKAEHGVRVTVDATTSSITLDAIGPGNVDGASIAQCLGPDAYPCDVLGCVTVQQRDVEPVPYQQAIERPEGERASSVGFNAAYLADLLLVQTAADASGVTVRTYGALDGAHITCGSWLVVQMPMRIE